MNCCEALITCSNRALTLLLQFQQELPNSFGRKISDSKLVNRLAGLTSYERQQQTESVAVAVLSISRQISDADQIL
jgi:hypothetical protein